MNRRYIRIGVTAAAAAVTLGVAAPMATAQEHKNNERVFQTQVVRATSEVTSYAQFVSFLNSAEGTAAMNEAELTQAERDALYSSDITSEAIVQGKISALKKVLKKIPGIINKAKQGWSKFKGWYADHVPAWVRWAIKWAWDLYKAWTWLKGL